VSTVAPQALYMMNHPFVLEQSRAAARRVLAGPEQNPGDRLTRAYRLTLGREPTAVERRVALEFIAKGREDEAAWTMVFQALLASIDFRYVN
jgi:hypothetical protein